MVRVKFHYFYSDDFVEKDIVYTDHNNMHIKLCIENTLALI